MNILNTLDDDIRLAEIHAKYWMAMATTGVGKMRELYHALGRNKIPFTEEEKIKDCMEIAQRHIRKISDLIEQKKEIIYNMNKNKNGGYRS